MIGPATCNPATLADPQVIQTYVRRRWFVSTCLRESSSMLSDGLTYLETIVWEWDPDTRERGKMLFCQEGNAARHFDLCRRLLEGRPLEDQEDE